MPENDTPAALLEKIVELQRQQLARLSELVEHQATLVRRNEKSHESYDRNAQLWEENQKKGVERDERREIGIRQRGIVALILLASIPVAIIISRYL